ncbi:MAG: type II toxin-antitoxin system HicA family toxin [Chloroflexi bacterium]|nr:type II toxin-antitoxin system HicA family toxin [Chloroflexota bacterium]
MSQRLPALRPREVIRGLERAGWAVVRQKGSHVTMGKEGIASIVVVPLHAYDMPRGTLRGVIADAGLTVEEFLKLLQKISVAVFYSNDLRFLRQF